MINPQCLKVELFPAQIVKMHSLQNRRFEVERWIWIDIYQIYLAIL